VALARRGYSVEGIDQAPHYIVRARRRADESRVNAEFLAADAFQVAATMPCRLVFNWWSSFGYASTDRQNLQMLLRAYESLEPDGLFVLDTMNAAQVLRNFETHRTTTRSTQQGNITIEAASTIDLAGGTIHKTWRIHRSNQSMEEVRSTVRLYAAHDLKRLCEEAGFIDIRFFGATDGRPLDLDAPRCIVSARRHSCS
ncbi:MAG: class I SAM-dependent methyltransferase, partial [Myxococcota bacterium]